MGDTVYEDVGIYLAGEGVLVMTGANRNAYGGNMPARPDSMFGLYEHSGFEPTWAMGRRVIDEIVVQVITRDVSQVIARNMAWSVYNALSAFNYKTPAQRTIGGVLYLSILARHPPMPLGQDENNRFRWTCSYVVRRSV